MKLNDKEQRDCNDMVQVLMEILSVEQLAEVALQLQEYLGVLKKQR